VYLFHINNKKILRLMGVVVQACGKSLK
jgi:hypothetical protein